MRKKRENRVPGEFAETGTTSGGDRNVALGKLHDPSTSILKRERAGNEEECVDYPLGNSAGKGGNGRCCKKAVVYYSSGINTKKIPDAEWEGTGL